MNIQRSHEFEGQHVENILIEGRCEVPDSLQYIQIHFGHQYRMQSNYCAAEMLRQTSAADVICCIV